MSVSCGCSLQVGFVFGVWLPSRYVQIRNPLTWLNAETLFCTLSPKQNQLRLKCKEWSTEFLLTVGSRCTICILKHSTCYHVMHIFISAAAPLPHKHAHTLDTTPAPNSGIVLWVQQFCGLFLKRVYNSFRFWATLVLQFFLPMAFVLLALLLAVTLPDPSENDPSRALRLENSGLSGDVDLFYADFSDGRSGIRFNVSV